MHPRSAKLLPSSWPLAPWYLAALHGLVLTKGLRHQPLPETLHGRKAVSTERILGGAGMSRTTTLKGVELISVNESLPPHSTPSFRNTKSRDGLLRLPNMEVDVVDV